MIRRRRLHVPPPADITQTWTGAVGTASGRTVAGADDEMLIEQVAATLRRVT